MDDLRALTDTCVHCGFCLPACPTYQLWGEEMDSPRGRIHLLRQMLDGAPVTSTVAGHFDACLGCLACVPACPSGVRYDEIIPAARSIVEHSGAGRSFVDRALRVAIFALFPYPRRMRAMRGPLRLARWLKLDAPRVAGRLHPSLGAMARLAPPLLPRVRLPRRVAARPGGLPGARRAVVGLLTGCVQNAFFSHVSAATARVLAMEGCDVVIPRRQGCCGALAHHCGRTGPAERSAHRVAAVFARAGVDAVVTDVAGCGSFLKESGAVRAYDVAEFLDALGEPLARRHPLRLTVAYHDACHLSHGQGVRAQPRALLAGIPGVRLVSPADPDTCCGSAGVYNLLQPDTATQLGATKAARLLDTGADVIAAGNPGCLLQIQAALGAGSGPPVYHTIELLDASLRGERPG
ncbi:MAG TPA: heterodisulfide reductase-related iron-sulfur binding cluster [Micromonosporaceae bacterium]|nr:heterodisulfide reductase-related iron-sulfur binding cluster [Micromonosporaceae bacterium]